MKIDLYENYTSTSVFHNIKEQKLTSWSKKYYKAFIEPHLGKNKNIRILEIGCGYGRYTQSIIQSGYNNIRGIDISEEQISYAIRYMGLENKVELADAIEYMTSKNEYDVILLMDVMEHLELSYTTELLQSIHRSLSKDGKLIIHVPNGLSPLKAPYHNDITHLRAFSSDSLSQLLRIVGFDKFNHFALPPLVTGFISFIRRCFWILLFNPLIKFYMLTANSSTCGGIFTPNILSVATK